MGVGVRINLLNEVVNMKKLAIALGVLALVGCGKGDPTPAPSGKPSAATDISLYAKVASIDAGMRLTEESPQTARTKQAIEQAATLCQLPEEAIAGKAVKVQSLLAEQKIAVQSVELLEMIPLVFNKKTDNDCSDILVHYASVRKGGMNHADSVAGLSALVKGVSK